MVSIGNGPCCVRVTKRLPGIQFHDLGSQLSDALEMADNESDALLIVERAMMSISSTAPMEVLLADSSKAHLERVASNPGVAASPAQSRRCACR